MVFRLLLLTGLLALAPGRPLSAQASGPVDRNRAYLELLGPGLVWSANYERALSGRVGWRGGVGGWPQEGVQYLVGLTGLTWRTGSPRHALVLQAGVGVGWFADVDALEEEDVFSQYFWGSAGYQYQPKPSGFFLRVSYTPLVSEGVAPLYGGLSLGWTF